MIFVCTKLFQQELFPQLQACIIHSFLVVFVVVVFFTKFHIQICVCTHLHTKGDVKLQAVTIL